MLRISDSLGDVVLSLVSIGVSIFIYLNARYDTYDNAYATIALVLGIVWLFDWEADDL